MSTGFSTMNDLDETPSVYGLFDCDSTAGILS